jgi:biopolymer transport protein ExbB/biopolymer transport protein TolQ
LLALSVASLTAAVERWRFFRRHHDDIAALSRRLQAALLEGDFEAADATLAASPSLEARIVRAALRWASGGAGAVADVVESELGQTRAALERGLTLLGTLGNNAPFVGLLGTVLGVIEAFHHLGGGQNKEAMGNVMAGIAEALVATGVGLFVALPAVVAYNLAQKRIGDIEAGVASLSKLVTAALRSRERDHERASATFAWALPPTARDAGAASVAGATHAAGTASVAGAAGAASVTDAKPAFLPTDAPVFAALGVERAGESA